MTTVVLGSWSPALAAIIAGRLRSEGVRVFPLPVDGSSLEGGPGSVRLMVADTEAETARSIIGQ